MAGSSEVSRYYLRFKIRLPVLRSQRLRPRLHEPRLHRHLSGPRIPRRRHLHDPVARAPRRAVPRGSHGKKSAQPRTGRNDRRGAGEPRHRLLPDLVQVAQAVERAAAHKPRRPRREPRGTRTLQTRIAEPLKGSAILVWACDRPAIRSRSRRRRPSRAASAIRPGYWPRSTPR